MLSYDVRLQVGLDFGLIRAVRALELWLLPALVALMTVQRVTVFVTPGALGANVSRSCN
jgi:hypothetical protein